MNQMLAAGGGFLGIGAWEVVILLALLVGAIVIVAAGSASGCGGATVESPLGGRWGTPS